MLRYHIIILIDSAGCYLFCEPCLPRYSVHHSLPPVRKCNNIRDPYEIPDFWLPNSPALNSLHYRIWGSKNTRKNAVCDWFEAASDWCVIWSETEHYWRWHWTVAQTSPCLHSSHGNLFQIVGSFLTCYDQMLVVTSYLYQACCWRVQVLQSGWKPGLHSFLTFIFHKVV